VLSYLAGYERGLAQKALLALAVVAVLVTIRLLGMQGRN
jgi:hypothetical protein